MSDLTQFCQSIEQEPYKGNLEKAGCRAIKFDDNDGFAKSLVENYANNCRVDYFEIIENGLIMIEMKHIRLKIENLSNEDKKSIKEVLLSNVENKFTHSLRIIQKEINLNLIPTINYLVVSNNTESNMLDRYLPESLKKKPFVICKTNEICEKLSTLDTRLCQE